MLTRDSIFNPDHSQSVAAVKPLASTNPFAKIWNYLAGEAKPQPRYLVLGGSNSLLSDGWVPQLAAKLPAGQVVNLSIGASPSMMGYYRLLEFPSAQAGDTVLWEYALNDEEFIQNRGAGIEDLLNFVRLTMGLCAERGLRFSAIILRSQEKLTNNPQSEYRRRLTDLFGRSGIRYFDMDQRLRAGGHVASPQGIAALYRDRVHVDPAAFITADIADWALQDGTPELAQTRPEGFDRLPRIVMAGQFSGTYSTSRFSSRLGSFSAHHPANPRGEMRLDCPRPGRFELVGFVLMRTLVSGVLICENSTARIIVGLRHPRVEFGKPLVVYDLARKVTGPQMVISEDDPPYFSWHKLPDQDAGCDDLGGIASVMLEAR